MGGSLALGVEGKSDTDGSIRFWDQRGPRPISSGIESPVPADGSVRGGGGRSTTWKGARVLTIGRGRGILRVHPPERVEISAPATSGNRVVSVPETRRGTVLRVAPGTLVVGVGKAPAICGGLPAENPLEWPGPRSSLGRRSPLPEDNASPPPQATRCVGEEEPYPRRPLKSVDA